MTYLFKFNKNSNIFKIVLLLAVLFFGSIYVQNNIIPNRDDTNTVSFDGNNFPNINPQDYLPDTQDSIGKSPVKDEFTGSNLGLDGYKTTPTSLTITSDATLLSSAITYGWPGTGTVDDPIIIEGHEFYKSSGYVVWMQSITKAVEFRNNYIHSGPGNTYGFYMPSGTSPLVRIHNNTIDQAGFILSASPNLEFYNNTVTNVESQFSITGSSNITFSYNIIDQSIPGVYLYNTHTNGNVTAVNNTITAAGTAISADYGLYAYVAGTGSTSIFSNNTFNDIDYTTSAMKLNLIGSKSIDNNKFVNATGIHIGDIPLFYFDFNSFSGNTIDGDPIVYLKDVTSLSIPANTKELIIRNGDSLTIDGFTTDTSIGIILVNVSNTVLKNLKISNSPLAVMIVGQYSQNILIQNSNFTNIGYAHFISHYATSDPNISCIDNIYNNVNYIARSSNTMKAFYFYNNTINTANNGIIFSSMSGNTNVTILNNTFSNIQTNSVYMKSLSSSVISNNTILNSDTFMLTGGSSNEIENNSFIGGGGIDIYSSSAQTSFTNNNIDGDPIVYLSSVSDVTVPSNAKQVYVYNSVNIEVKGLSISGVNIAIYMYSVTNSIISDNQISDTNYAIYLRGDNNEISNNTIDSIFGFGDNYDGSIYSAYGIYAYGLNTTITENSVSNIDDYGIYLYQGSNSKVTNNSVKDVNSYGVQIYLSHDSIIANNVINASTQPSSSYGIYAASSNNLELTNNTIIDYAYCMAVTNSAGNLINYNTIRMEGANAAFGMYLSSQTSSQILNNYVYMTQGSYTVYMSSGSDSLIQYNDFLGKTGSVSSSTTHVVLNNYWSLHTNVDGDSDGYADSPYTLSGGKTDTQPLASPLYGNYPAPVILLSPASNTLSELGTGELIWSAADIDNSTYKWYLDTVLQNTAGWNNYENVTIDISSFAPGIYTVKIEFYDLTGLFTSDTITLTVGDSVTPILTAIPTDTSYELGSVGHDYSWTATDLDASSYSVRVDGGSASTGSWTSGVSVDLNFDGLSEGVHSINMIFIDKSGNKVEHIFTLTVTSDVTDPSIATSPADTSYELGTIGNNYSWNATDLFASTYSYRIDGGTATVGVWTSGTFINLNFDGLSEGVHSINVTFVDVAGNSVEHIFTLTVTSDVTDPTIATSPADTSYELGSIGNNYSWNATDLFASTYSYRIDGGTATIDLWTSGTFVDLNFNDLSEGVHSINVTFVDIAGNSVEHIFTLTVTADVTDPVLDTSPTDTSYELGSIDNIYSWNATDLFAGTYSYRIDGGSATIDVWTSGTFIDLNFDGLSEGVHLINMTFVDVAGNSVEHIFTLTITADNTNPNVIASPADTSYELGSLGNYYSWNVTDLYSSTYSYRIDGGTATIDVWTSGTFIDLNFDGLSEGVHLINMTFVDVAGNSVEHIFTLTITPDVTAPIVTTSPLDASYEFGTINHIYSWNATDLFNSSYSYRVDGGSETIEIWDSGRIINLNFDGLSEGVHSINMTFVDVAGNSVEHIFTLTVTPDITDPVITSSPADTGYEFGSVGNSYSWMATDLNGMSYSCSIDGLTTFDGSWFLNGQVTLNLDGLSLGSHIVTFIFTDIGGNTAEHTLTLTVVDTTKPVLVVQEFNLIYEFGSTDNTISANVTDLAPDYYEVFVDDVLELTANWTSESIISINVDGLNVGEHDLRVIYYDTSNNSLAVHTVISVYDKPVIDQPLDILYLEDTLGNLIQWTATDNNPNIYRVYQNGSLYTTGSWVSGEMIEINIDGLVEGNYNFTIIVFDHNDYSISDSVIVGVFTKASLPPGVTVGVIMAIIAAGGGMAFLRRKP